MEKFKGKYRVPTARASFWDYGWNGHYFITICTKDKKHYFGKISDGKMHLSTIGEIALEIWKEIPGTFPYAKLDSFVVMPNHIHGIIEIDKNADGIPEGNQYCSVNRIEKQSSDKLGGKGGITGHMNPMNNKNLSRIIRWYKGSVTYDARIFNPAFEWHARYHDHIIRDFESYEKISNYIEMNPEKWSDDKYYQS